MSALQKIVQRVKALRKKHPNAKYRTLQKQAGREFKAGKLKAKRKPAAKKRRKTVVRRKSAVRKTVRKVAPRKRAKRTVRRKALSPAVPKRKRVYRAKRTKVKAYKAKRYKRVSGTGGGMMSTILPIAAVVVGGLLIYKLMTPSAPAYTNTTNPYRVAAQNNLLQWAQAAGLGISAITSMINAINNKSDAEVIALAQSKDSASQWLYNEYGV